MNYYGNYFSGYELRHFGILGQKWGVRRFQNPDGSLTAEGKQRYRKELKEDRKKSFEAGKRATVNDTALYNAHRDYEKQIKRFDKAYRKDQGVMTKRTRRLGEKALIAQEVEKKLRENAEISRKDLIRQYEAMDKKYGKERVRDIKYDKHGNVNESVVSGRDFITALLLTAGGTAVGSAAGFGVVSTPANKYDLANNLYLETYLKVAKELKSKLKE